MSAARSFRCTSSSGRADIRRSMNVNDVKPNADVKIDAPQVTAGAAGAGATPAAQSEKLGDGVYLITGGYSAIAVDFKDHIAILEGGQSEARGLAVIAE